MAATRSIVVKVNIDGDLRRLSVDLPAVWSPECSDEAYLALRTAVAGCFGVPESSLPALKYRDEEDDLCTVAVSTMSDLLKVMGGGPIRLVGDSSVAPKAATSGSHPPAKTQTPSAARCAEEAAPAPAEPAPVPDVEPAHSEAAMSSFEIRPDGEAAAAEPSEAAAAAAAPESPCSDDVADQKVPPPQGRDEALACILEMGFAEEDALRALDMCRDNLENAIDYLVTGRKPPEPLHTKFSHLLAQVQERIAELRAKLQPLREAAARHWERRSEHRETAREEGRRQLAALQEAIGKLREQLREARQHWSETAFDAAEKVKGRFGEAAENAKGQLSKLDAQLDEAEQFLHESIAGLKRRSGSFFSGASSAEEAAAEETAHAAAEASADAAAEAILTAEHVLAEAEQLQPRGAGREEQRSDGEAAASASEVPAPREQEVAAPTEPVEAVADGPEGPRPGIVAQAQHIAASVLSSLPGLNATTGSAAPSASSEEDEWQTLDDSSLQPAQVEAEATEATAAEATAAEAAR